MTKRNRAELLAALAAGRHTYAPGREDAKGRTVCALCGGLWEDPRHRPARRRRASTPRVLP
jgi:hypothetical protein